jgi:hypothetical protein
MMKIRVEHELTVAEVKAGLARAVATGYWYTKGKRYKDAVSVLRSYLRANGTPDTDLSDVDDESIRDAEDLARALYRGRR